MSIGPEIATAVVRVRPSTAGFGPELAAGVKKETHGLAKQGLHLGAAFLGFEVGKGLLKEAFHEMSEMAKASAKTEAVLKSTGNAAGVTAKHVEELAHELLKVSGVDDEIIHGGENLLLTFRNIRNEAGKGRDIFDQTTRSALDMSLALGTSMRSAALQLGKALNDPVKGLARLTRVGVTFTAEQEKSIKKLATTGHLLEAQQIILEEVNKKFGGVAETVGKTLPGQFAILREEIKNALGRVATAVTGPLLDLVATLRQVLQVGGQIASVVLKPLGELLDMLNAGGVAADLLKGALGGIAIALTAYAAAQAVQAAASAAATVAQWAFNAAVSANPITLFVVALAALTGALVALYRHNERFHEAVDQTWADIRQTIHEDVEFIRALWADWGDEITAVAQAVFGYVRQTAENALRSIRGIFQIVGGLLTGDWRQMWTGVKNLFGGALDQMLLNAKGHITAFRAVASEIGGALTDGFVLGIGGLVNALVEWVEGLGKQIAKYAVEAYHWGLELGGQIAKGIYDGLPTTKLGGLIGGALHSGVEWARDHAGSTLAELAARELGANIAKGTGQGMEDALPLLQRSLTSSLQTAIKTVDVGQTVAEQIQAAIDGIDASKIGQEASSLAAQNAAAQVAAQFKELQDNVAKARQAYFEATTKPLPGLFTKGGEPGAKRAEAIKQRQELERAIAEAERKLTQFQNEQRQAQLEGVLAARRAALESQLAAQQAVDSAYEALAQSRAAASAALTSAAQATAQLNAAVAAIPGIAQRAMVDAFQNLEGLAGQLGDSIGQYLDQHLADQLEGLSHSSTARAISSIDKRLREESEQNARESARRSVADARRSLREQTKGVKDAQAELQKILRQGRKKGDPGKVTTTTTGGVSLREMAYQRIIFPEDEPIAGTTTTTRTGGSKGESAAEFAKRVADARKAVEDAKQQRVDAVRSVREQEESLHTLLLQQQRDRLARALEARRRELTDEEAATKASIKRQLTDLAVLYNRNLIPLSEFQKRVEKLVGNDKETWQKISASLGYAVASEFWHQLKALGFQATAIAQGPRDAAVGRTGHEKTVIFPAVAVTNAIKDAERLRAARDAQSLAALQAIAEWQRKLYEAQKAYNALLRGRKTTANTATGNARR